MKFKIEITAETPEDAMNLAQQAFVLARDMADYDDMFCTKVNRVRNVTA